MPKFFLDTEFHEYHKEIGTKGNTIPTIDLISVGIVDESGKEFYTISGEFDVEDAWNSYQEENGEKVYWLRDNVLKPIFIELSIQSIERAEKKNTEAIQLFNMSAKALEVINRLVVEEQLASVFNLSNMKMLVHSYGYSKETIAKSIIEFVYSALEVGCPTLSKALKASTPIEFYAYYADYDWVVFAQLFGKMIDLPRGFPMYCRDLKQMYDDMDRPDMRSYPSYPTQAKGTEHNAVSDAQWNKELYEFLQSMKR